jgi:catechol 2,3-dioxygenase-like lactoylglutathione lyase family enzyme
MITGVAHIAFTVRDLEASLAFYRDQLGLTPAFDMENKEGRRVAVYLHAGGRTFVEIVQGDPVPPDYRSTFRHLCLEVDDLETTAAALRERGVEVSEVHQGITGCMIAFIADPDNNRIELHGYLPESKQTPWVTGAGDS